MPFAARSYAERRGLPTCPDELCDHTLVFQVAEQTTTLSTYGKTLPDLERPPFVAIKTDVSSAQMLAVANGGRDRLAADLHRRPADRARAGRLQPELSP
ncbi:hypothetical protein [Methylobacterium sp. V23]|uniref:hypothetical protein n=1 Tax=Methylobacterium sp. V23 TaxID=2044878 RepID=UPI000CDAC2BA|nr:hypothetical protein [Methylobacterium sp. V23]POR41323.1 hypothetical protein CRT23_19410 [Methylobacterium sp. V23]